MLVGYLIPGLGFDKEEKDRRQRLLGLVAGQNATIELLTVDKGPKSVESEIDEKEAEPHLVDLAMGIRNNYDGFIVGCYTDLALETIRRVTEKPVIGPVRASFGVACSVCEGFAIITPQEALVSILQDRAERLGFRKRINEIISVNIPILNIVSEPDYALECFRGALKKVESEIVIAGCMSYSFLFLERNIRTLDKKRIINPLVASVEIAKAFLV